jgi:putative membrane protein
MQLLINWLIFTLAVIVTAFVLPGVAVSGLLAAAVTAAVLGIINAFVLPFLLELVAPINAVTLGLFTFVVNALLVMLTSAIVPGFKVNGFWWALLFSVILTVVMVLLYMVF